MVECDCSCLRFNRYYNRTCLNAYINVTVVVGLRISAAKVRTLFYCAMTGFTEQLQMTNDEFEVQQSDLQQS